MKRASPKIPSDDNGVVLQRMWDGGDSLTKPRIIDFCFIFPHRGQAIEFAAATVRTEFEEVAISRYAERRMWQVIVRKMMKPKHAAITALETELSSHAKKCGGAPDGWGCMRITDNK